MFTLLNNEIKKSNYTADPFFIFNLSIEWTNFLDISLIYITSLLFLKYFSNKDKIIIINSKKSLSFLDYEFKSYIVEVL
jgi:hypothetical protein